MICVLQQTLIEVRASLASDSFQATFHSRWGHLRDPHVRALAWLITAPDLLDPRAPQWRGKIASLPIDETIDNWLGTIDAAPEALHAFLALSEFERLGRYAEKLLAYYFAWQGTLVAHGVQVRTERNLTVGEFDFLLRDGAALVHWEFATKLYLLEGSADADFFVGPNLADSLDAKMHKILERQLSLGHHPDARALLPGPIARAQALIKGWLFYHRSDQPSQAMGVSPDHCRGFWCAFAETDTLEADAFVVLSRLSWLAPMQTGREQTMSKSQLIAALTAHFAIDSSPVVIATMATRGDLAQEIARGFIVPDDWRERAGERAQRAFIAAK